MRRVVAARYGSLRGVLEVVGEEVSMLESFKGRFVSVGEPLEFEAAPSFFGLSSKLNLESRYAQYGTSRGLRVLQFGAPHNSNVNVYFINLDALR